ncbi:MAG TPA: PEP/pyruvate-binding domain-containing protein, partial [Acidimicrobiia bacterium]|nr:PEP/pyruvate-binding domain-containing protein [Acidimicrobiia bacterium]
MTSSTTLVVAPLNAFGRADVATAGGKGANLGELVRAGFGVPDGFVVSTQAYRDALRSAGVEAGPGVLETMTLPADLVAAIAEAYEGLGGGPVAVRSSATAEDLPGAAFAGQQETFLNVVGLTAVVDAVRDCWASLWGERAVAYRSRLDEPVDLAIAVVVQRMVDAEFAGVLFTANPVTGARDEVVVELSPGLGEAVVSGLVTPERVLTDDEGRVRERRAGRQEVVVRAVAGGGVTAETPAEPPPPLPSAVLSELARTGGRIAHHFGRPQDIEWAHAGGTTWIVQARPMTALPPPPRKVNRARRLAGTVSAELVPTRPYPLDLTAWTLPAWFAILRAMAAELAGLSIDVDQMLRTTDAVVTELVPPDPRPTWRTLSSPLRLRARRRRYDPAVWTADPRFAVYERRLAGLGSPDVTTLAWPELVAVPGEVLDALHAFVGLRIDYLPAVLAAAVRLRLLLAGLGLSAEFWPLLAGQLTQTRAANS